jgi:general secretion pathway protein C
MVKNMWPKITRFLKEHFKEIRNMNARQIMDADFLKTLLICLTITILSFETTDLFYKLISIPLTKQDAAVTDSRISSSADNNPRHQLQEYSIITERNLFLSTLKEAGGNEGGGVFDSEQKAADFDLRGTVACNSSVGFIFIEERGSKKQKLYRLGDMIGSSKLIKITRNTATLRSGGRDLTLKVKSTIEGQLLPDSPDGNSSTSRNLTLSKTAVNEKLNNLNTLMNKAVVRPFIKRGVQEGFVISNIAPDSLYEKMGLQNGDIIIDVNNNKIKGADSLLQAVNLMQSGSNIALNIKRKGKEETINYTFK